MNVNDSIVSKFTDKSEKPLLLYEMIHTLVPSGYSLKSSQGLDASGTGGSQLGMSLKTDLSRQKEEEGSDEYEQLVSLASLF